MNSNTTNLQERKFDVLHFDERWQETFFLNSSAHFKFRLGHFPFFPMRNLKWFAWEWFYGITRRGICEEQQI